MTVSEAKVVKAQGVEMADMVDAIERSGQRFVALLEGLDPAESARPVPHMKWTVAETAVHMLAVLRRGMGDRRRMDTLDGLAKLNDETIAEVETRDLSEIAATISAEMQVYVELLRAAPADMIETKVSKLHAGVLTNIPTALSYQLVDLLCHGWDIATASGAAWEIDPADAALALRGALPALQPWVNPDVLDGEPRRTAFTFPGAPSSIVIETGAGSYDVTAGPREEAEAEVDPVDMMLTATGRTSSDDPYITRIATWYRPA